MTIPNYDKTSANGFSQDPKPEPQVFEGWANVYDEHDLMTFDMSLFFYKDNRELAESKLENKGAKPLGGKTHKVRIEILE